MGRAVVALFGSHVLLQVIWSFLTVGVIKGCLLMLAAVVVAKLMRARASESRHLVWFGALVGLLILPLFWLVLPPVQLGTPGGESTSSVLREIAVPLFSQNHYLGLPVTANGSAALSRQARPGALPLLACVVMGVWILGGLFFFFRMFMGQVGAVVLAASARRAAIPSSLLKETQDRLSVRRRVTVLSSARCSVPFTFGHLRPRVLLPAASSSWSQARLRAVLLHELAHIRRSDWLLNSVARGICALLWFLPLAWVAFSRMQQEEEASCDRSVLQNGIRGTAYATDLVEIVRAARRHPLVPDLACSLGKKNLVRRRIVGVLRFASRRETARVHILGRALVVGFCCLLPLLAVTCATAPGGTPGSRLLGTWVNTAYTSTYWKYKMVFEPDGKELKFSGAPSDTPSVEGRYVVDKEWRDAQGDTWYQVLELISFLPYNAAAASGNRWYSLIRMNRNGDTLEVGSTHIGAMTSFGMYGSLSVTYYRQ